MIISDKLDKYDESSRIVLFDQDKDGKCVPTSKYPEFGGEQNLINTLYYTRAEKLKKLKQQLFDGEISPIKLFTIHFGMNDKDISRRIKVPLSKVKKHMTMEGFKKVSIEILMKYAVIFDISIVDFFQFINIKEDFAIDIKEYHNRMVQDIDMSTGEKK